MSNPKLLFNVAVDRDKSKWSHRTQKPLGQVSATRHQRISTVDPRTALTGFSEYSAHLSKHTAFLQLIGASGLSGTRDSLFQLQRQFGNRHVQRVLDAERKIRKPPPPGFDYPARQGRERDIGTGGSIFPGLGVRPTPVDRRLQRAQFNVGSLTIKVDYSGLTSIATPNYVNQIENRFTAWTGSAAATIHANLVALNGNQRRWVLFALDLLIDNTTASHSALNRVDAVQRLISHASTAANQPLSAGFNFENEVMRVSGWFEVALAAPLTAPSGATLTTITGLYNPPPVVPGAALNLATLQAELPPALTAFLQARDPAAWGATGAQSLVTLQSIADDIQGEARTFFAPYADTAMRNVYSQGWAYSTALQSTLSIAPTNQLRIGYLLNRAELVGRRNRVGGSIFTRANYDSSRAADRTALRTLVTPMASDPVIRPIVDRLIQHTGRARPSARRVWVSTEFRAGTPNAACRARWRTIDTLAHELVHILVHPDFPTQAHSIRFGQIVREGFTEVLGVQLHRRLVTKANANAAYKAQMEAGIPGAPCSSPAVATIGYGAAGSAAEQIRSLVGDDNFRAAYFLGAVNLVGL